VCSGRTLLLSDAPTKMSELEQTRNRRVHWSSFVRRTNHTPGGLEYFRTIKCVTKAIAKPTTIPLTHPDALA